MREFVDLGSRSAEHSVEAKDYEPLDRTYYRVVAYDEGGERPLTFSNTVAIVAKQGKAKIHVTPNPAFSFTKLSLGEFVEGPKQFWIANPVGTVVYEREWPGLQREVEIELPRLAEGMYRVFVKTPTEVVSTTLYINSDRGEVLRP